MCVCGRGRGGGVGVGVGVGNVEYQTTAGRNHLSPSVGTRA